MEKHLTNDFMISFEKFKCNEIFSNIYFITLFKVCLILIKFSCSGMKYKIIKDIFNKNQDHKYILLVIGLCSYIHNENPENFNSI